MHCHIGCDRTGVVSAMLLGLAGVSDDEICVDYARSTRASAAIRERAEDRRRHLGLPLMGPAYYDAWEPRPETMAAALDLVAREWRDMSGWASALVSPSTTWRRCAPPSSTRPESSLADRSVRRRSAATDHAGPP